MQQFFAEPSWITESEILIRGAAGHAWKADFKDRDCGSYDTFDLDVSYRKPRCVTEKRRVII